MDAATFIGDGQVEPKVGDVGFCCACGLALLYGPGMIVEECPEAIQQKAAKILAAMQKARLEVKFTEPRGKPRIFRAGRDSDGG